MRTKRHESAVLTEVERRALEGEGYVVLVGVFGTAEVARMRDAVAAALADRTDKAAKPSGGTLHVDLDGPALEPISAAPRLLAAVTALLGPAWTMTRIALRAPRPGYGAQQLHGAATLTPAKRGVLAGLVTAIVPLVDFTADNGATRIVPGSHRAWTLRVPRHPDDAARDERLVTAAAGSVIVFPEAIVHSGTRNRSGARRDSLQISYSAQASGPSM